MTQPQGSLIEGRTGLWETVIGIEIHAQVISKAKLFSSASTAFGAEPNSQVSLIDAAMPGMLPVLNQHCVIQAVRTGLALNAVINRLSAFDRKNYFYPDLPQGYQISQFHHPIVGEGSILIELPNGTQKRIRIERLHLEQDAGKSLHDQHPLYSYIDLNRSGVALMEIVSRPDLNSPEEAGAYIRKIRSILRYVESCDGNMEQGSLRADVNVSVRRPGDPLGTRCEIKNVNSIRFVQQAITYEAGRQIAVLEDGGTIQQETLLFDPARGETRSMRSKEFAHDYRYFPDPDLIPLELSEDFIHQIQEALPELPDTKKERFKKHYGLNEYDADLLVTDRTTADYFEDLARARDGKMVANWLMGSFFAALNRSNLELEQAPVTRAQFGRLLDLVTDGTLSGRLAKEVFEAMWDTGQDPDSIIAAKGLRQITEEEPLIRAIAEILTENADKVAEYRSGKDKLYGFFVGQVMKKTGGKANPTLVNKLLMKALQA